MQNVTHIHTHTKKKSQLSYTADALVFDVKKLLLRELHVEEILEDKSITNHSIL